MIRNYFKIAFRNIRRYAAHSILNISGMAIGMACAILLLLWVWNEFSYDKFRKNADYLYRVLERHYTDGNLQQMATTPYPLAAALKEEYPEIIRSSRYQNYWTSFPKGENIIEGTLANVDRDFFEMFEIKFVKGNSKNALTGPYDIVITEEMANKYFNNEDPIGKPMIVWPNYIFNVTGVIKKIPRNSFFYVDCLTSFEFSGMQSTEGLNEWNNHAIYTFVELMENTDSKLVEDKIKYALQENLKGSNAEIFLQNITRIHLYSQGKYAYDINSGNMNYVRLAILIAVLILTIACINFMGLSTAQSFKRAKEVGIRKIAGASKQKILFQFLGESLLIVFIAHVLAMILVEVLLPAFNNIIAPLVIEVNYHSIGLYAGLFSIVLFCGLLAGSYPALYLSSLKTLNIAKGVVDKNPGKLKFRKLLVISQFTLSFLFILCTLIVGKQLNYLQNSNLGLNLDNVCRFSFNDINAVTLKKDLSNIPGILNATITSESTISIRETTDSINWTGKQDGNEIVFHILKTDEEYAKTFQLELSEGRYFSSEYSTDNAAMVINETATKIMGLKNPIGENLSYNGLNYKIIGVLRDYHFQSLHLKIKPLIIMFLPISSTRGVCNIKLNTIQSSSTLNKIKNKVNSYNLDYPLNIGFLDDDYKFNYFIEQKMGVILGFVTILAIMISILGMIGLSTFMTLRRTKEIGIRKANGAKTIEIFSMLSKEYLKLVMISFILASPVAWFAMNIWLQSYAYRTNIGWWVFALALIIVVAITMFTIGFQSYKAANKNPVEALRYE